MAFAEPLLPRHSWFVALLLGTVATPAAVILGALAPRPIDAVLAWPLVLFDIWLGPDAGGGARLSAFAAGAVLTWLTYVLLARVVLWRVVSSDRSTPE